MVRLLQAAAWVGAGCVRRGFNPTMVRLLLTSSDLRILLLPTFQSHNGAIAAVDKLAFEVPLDEFQSHNGAIAAFSTIHAPPG